MSAKKKLLSATSSHSKLDETSQQQPKALTADNVLITRLQTQLHEARSRAFVFDDMMSSL